MYIDTRAIEKEISKDRFSIFLKAANGNRNNALKLYVYNKAISSSFYCVLQDLEVVLRVAADKRLVETYGRHWCQNPDAGFNLYAVSCIERAKREIGNQNNMIIGRDDRIPDHLVKYIVPKLTFGFWTKIFGTGNEENSPDRFDYENTLWRPALCSIFPKEKNRKEIYKLINNSRILRNNIAHHYAIIFNRNLKKDYEDILTLLAWLSPATRDMVLLTSRIPYLLENRTNVDFLNPFGI